MSSIQTEISSKSGSVVSHDGDDDEQETGNITSPASPDVSQAMDDEYMVGYSHTTPTVVEDFQKPAQIQEETSQSRVWAEITREEPGFADPTRVPSQPGITKDNQDNLSSRLQPVVLIEAITAVDVSPDVTLDNADVSFNGTTPNYVEDYVYDAFDTLSYTANVSNELTNKREQKDDKSYNFITNSEQSEENGDQSHFKERSDIVLSKTDHYYTSVSIDEITDTTSRPSSKDKELLLKILQPTTMRLWQVEPVKAELRNAGEMSIIKKRINLVFMLFCFRSGIITTESWLIFLA